MDSSAALSAQQLILVQAASSSSRLQQMSATLHRPSGDVTEGLVDDGSVAGDVAEDGIYVAAFSGDPARFVDIELSVTGATSEAAYRRVVLAPDARLSRLSFYIEEVDGALVVSRTAWVQAHGRHPDEGAALALNTGLGWIAVCVLYVACLVALGQRR